MRPPLFEYRAFSTKKGDNSTGKIIIGNLKNYGMYRHDYKDGDMLLVHFIRSFSKNNGFGEFLMDFAKNLSKQNGCNGYLILKATNVDGTVPHLFYRKMGLSTLNSELDKEMDTFIDANKKATPEDFNDMLMFYPPLKKEEVKFSLLQRIINLFKKTSD